MPDQPAETNPQPAVRRQAPGTGWRSLARSALLAPASMIAVAILLRPPWRKALGIGLLAAISLTLGILTFRRNAQYGTDVSLWGDTVVKAPHNPRAHYNLGVVLIHADRIAEAIEQCDEALRLKPDYAEAHNNLGGALIQTGRIPEGIEHCSKALRLRPGYAEAHNNLGGALIYTGRIPEAVEHCNEALRLKPGFPEAHYSLGNALIRSAKIPQAIGQYNEALRQRPNFAEAHNNLGIALVNAGRLPEAAEHFSQAVRLKPDYADAQSNLGGTLAHLGKFREAIEHCGQALLLAPDRPEVHRDLAWLLATHEAAEGGDPARALPLAQRACDLTSGRDARCLGALAAAYAAAGRFPEAVAAGQKALQAAEASGQEPLARAIRSQLEFYQAGQPYRERPSPK